MTIFLTFVFGVTFGGFAVAFLFIPAFREKLKTMMNKNQQQPTKKHIRSKRIVKPHK